MIKRRKLLDDLKPQVRSLEADLRAQIIEELEFYERLKAEYEEAFEVERTAATWEVWRNERVTQAAVAWVLGTVFVRFCEDNELLDYPFLAGPTRQRMMLAEEAQEQFFRDHPEETDRGWILTAFETIESAVQAGINGMSLFNKRHNPLYQIPVSHDAAKALIAFWRRRYESGELVHDFRGPEWDTRFLGDLYQDLSEEARKKYALLQTPEFVEESILDLTLTRAIEEFGLEEIKLIDPACGSGHFLLEALRRLLKEWENYPSPGDAMERVRLALESIHGVDINPFAVAIARFRLLVFALRSAGVRTLREAVHCSFPVNIAVGDSLIKARQAALFPDRRDRLAEFAFRTEDLQKYPRILELGRYHVVVGNPPYHAVKDRRLNRLYRELYSVCSGHYNKSVPFIQRCFELARGPNKDGRGAGYVGLITANSFMRREFGRKVIEDYLATQVELTHVIDTSGVFIPGHGTPTVILIGRNNRIGRSVTIRTVLGIRGEPVVPENPAAGRVWSSIVENIDKPGVETDYISVVDLPRESLAKYPWSLSGGGAGDVRAALNLGSTDVLRSRITEIGFGAVTREDEVYIVGEGTLKRQRIPGAEQRALVEGDVSRDWTITEPTMSLWPYDPVRLSGHASKATIRFLWPFRRILSVRIAFGQSQLESGLAWFEYSMFFRGRYRIPRSIAWGEVSTHNHFVLDAGGKVFNRTAPVIKLAADASDDDHLRLLGLLNSSAGCFWLKQVCHDKGIRGEGGGITSDEWERFYQFNLGKLMMFPIPAVSPLALTRKLDGLAKRLAQFSCETRVPNTTPTRDRLTATRADWHSTRARMIALQEELDWQVYTLYGLLPDELTAPTSSIPGLQLGERAFEIVIARKMAVGEVETQWFARHGSTPITEIPAHWPEDYKALVEKRIAVIENNRSLALIERPECKRRWATEGWDKMQERALRNWLLDHCETRDLWYHEVDGIEQPRPMTAARLAHELRRDPDIVSVADLYAPGKDFTKVIEDLVADEYVPYLAALCYRDSGLETRADWEYVWDQQRNEDAASDEATRAKIRSQTPVPPKYTSADFQQTSYWRHRGKLDVPKERFISYPYANRDGDPSLLLGWAGWDHCEQAQALATLIGEREAEDGWDADRLTPLLAGLREVMPWVRQWHGEVDPAYGGSPADGYDTFLTSCQERLHLTDETLTAWRPPKPTRGRKKKS